MVKFFPGMKEEDLPEGEGYRVDKFNDTQWHHLDAPYHFQLTMDKGSRAIPSMKYHLSGAFNQGSN